jgi:hypothetical protein
MKQKHNWFWLQCAQIHNCAKTASDSMPVDIEVLVMNIFRYFHIHTVRVERTKDFCDFAGQEYTQICKCKVVLVTSSL